MPIIRTHKTQYRIPTLHTRRADSLSGRGTHRLRPARRLKEQGLLCGRSGGAPNRPRHHRKIRTPLARGSAKASIEALSRDGAGAESECTQAAGAVAEYHVTRGLRKVLCCKAIPVAEHGRELQANGEPVFAELGCKAAEPNHPRHGAGDASADFGAEWEGHSKLRHAASAVGLQLQSDVRPTGTQGVASVIGPEERLYGLCNCTPWRCSRSKTRSMTAALET